MFIDDITEFLAEALSQHQNIIVAGDFTMHINGQDDPEANILMDTMTALGLQQYTNFATHCRGNTIDLIFTEILMRQKVLNVHQVHLSQTIVQLTSHCQFQKLTS